MNQIETQLTRLASISSVAVDDDRLTLANALSDSFPLETLLQIAEIPRRAHFGNKVQIHILDNIRNGFCPEDCGYCAQRKSAAPASIASYPLKEEDEILKEAEQAFKSGAYRFCLVTAGTGPTEKQALKYADLIKKIKTAYPMRLCLSAGIIQDPGVAEILADAGLDRYNHNLNTSENHTPEIVSSHTFQDRVTTIEHVRNAGISVCSGIIAGMGESKEDLADLALKLRNLGVPSIPVNFFLPVPGHVIKDVTPLSAEYCLRILSVFRIANPTAEIRAAAGREIHLKDRQKDALRVANSIFVSGYLNVKGSNAFETYRMISESGFEIDAEKSDLKPELQEALISCAADSLNSKTPELEMKRMEELREFKSRV